MSGAEVAYRVARSVRTVSEHFGAQEVPPRDAFATDLRFLPPFMSLAPDTLIAAADRVLAGSYSFFDLEDCDLGDPPQWNRDPLTQHVADVRRAGTIDYRDERVVGNIKYLWEANRHLHLVTLAQAHALTGDARYALAVRAQVDSWIEQCPVGRGPNWVSALELGIRLINWSLTWQLLGGLRSPPVRRRGWCGLPRSLAQGHLRAGAHGRRQPVALFLGQQSPDRRGGRCVHGGDHVAAVAADARMGRALP